MRRTNFLIQAFILFVLGNATAYAQEAMSEAQRRTLCGGAYGFGKVFWATTETSLELQHQERIPRDEIRKTLTQVCDNYNSSVGLTIMGLVNLCFDQCTMTLKTKEALAMCRLGCNTAHSVARARNDGASELAYCNAKLNQIEKTASQRSTSIDSSFTKAVLGIIKDQHTNTAPSSTSRNISAPDLGSKR